MAKVIPLPNGSYFPIDEGQSVASALAEARQYYPDAFAPKQAQPEAQPEGGFFPALKSAYSAVKSEGAGLLGRSGLMDLAEAEKYIEEQKKYQADTFKGTTKSWSEDPITHVKELIGGSLPYMVAPALAGAAVAGGVALAPEAAAAAGLAELLPSAGLGAAARYGLTSAGSRLATGLAGATSAAQFTGSNLARQQDEGKSLGETDLTSAALAAIPQAALDTFSLHMMPGLGKIFESAGLKLGKEEVKNFAEEGLKKTAADYLLKTGKTMGIEGLTEAGQQVFERAQAGLSITDPEARQEYFDNFVGGAVLAGVLGPAGRYVERGHAQARYDMGEAAKQQAAQQEQLKLDALAAAEEEQKKSSPEYFQTLSAEYKAAEQAKNDLKGQLRKVVAGSETETADRLHNQEITAQLKEMSPGVTALAAEYNRLLKVQPKAEEVAVTPPVKPNLAVGDTLDNPLGNFTKEELASRAPTVAKYIDAQRKKAGKPALETYSIEDIRNAMPNQLPEAEQADLSSLVAAKSGHTGDITYKPTDVIEAAKQKNIDTTTEGFKDFLRRATGDAELEQLTQPQLHSAFTALSSLPRFDEPQILPQKRNATDYSKEQYDKAVAALQKLVEERRAGTEVVKEGEKPIAKPVSIEEANQVIKAKTGLKNDVDAQTLFRDANRNGDIDLKGNEVTYQPKGAQAEFNIEEGTAPAEGTGFNIMRDGKMLFATNDEAEATAKAEKLGKDAAPAIQQVDKSIAKENATVADSQRALDAMEAEGKFNTPQYTQAAARHAGVVDKANKTIANLNAKKQMLQKPVTVQKSGKPTNRKTFTVKEKGVEEKAFNTRQEAEKHALENLPEERLNELATQTKAPGFANRLKKEQERRKKPVLALPAPKPPAPKGPSAEATALHAKLLPMLRKFGLGDVALKIQEAMAEEGSYGANVITVALDADNPIRVLRHETIHGLKDLGFFTPGQWKVLENKADKEWTDKYLKQRSRDGGPLKAGEQSRYDAYDKYYKGNVDNIREEAIADAFADFDVNGAPKGLFAQLLDAMRKFFRNLRSALTGAGYETAEDIFGKVERGELKATKAAENEEAKLSKRKSSYGLDILKGVEPAPDFGKKPLVDDVAKHFDEQVMKQFGRKLDYNNPEDMAAAVKMAAKEVKYQMESEQSGLDWYDDDIKKAFTDTAKVIPSLKDESKRQLFSIMAGILSPQINARDNWFIAAKAFEHYEKTGVIPGVNPDTGGLWQGGTQSPNKKKAMDFLNNMVKAMGEEGTLDWLQSNHTVKEINEFRKKYGGMSSGIDGKLNDERPGLYAFGPKVGPFVSNINGIHDVTVDKWATRTFNRYFGTMTDANGKVIDAPTEPQRRAVKALMNEVASDANIKNYQVQSLLWFYEQKLFRKFGTDSPSYGFSQGAEKLLSQRGVRGGDEGVGTTKAAQEKPSLRSGVIAEVAPNPDQEVAKKWRNMSPADKLRTTTAVANKAVGRVFDELGLKGYTFEVSSGRYEGEINPNVLVYAPKGASIEELSELSKVLGYVLDQKAMVSFDEGDVTSGSQAGFVKVAVPDGMSDADLARLREHISEKVPQADSDTLREKSLLYGNFSAYNDSVDTLTDEQYHRAIRDAVLDFEYDGIVDVSDIHKFHSEFTWPDNREAYLEGTRYGTSEGYRSTERADVRRGGRGNLDNISQEAISLRDRWIESTARPEQPAVRPSRGGDEGITLGEQQDGAVSFQGTHYGKNATPLLLGRMSGTGIKGAEQARLANSTDSRIKQRVYFYIPKPDGSMPKPESGLGNHVHTQRLNNILSPGKEMNKLSKLAGGDFNKFESNVVDAGYDGYAIPDMGMMVTLNHDVPTTYQGTVADLRSSGRLQDNQVKASLRTAPDTPEFKKWFGDSKIVDADGNPKVMYHGTAQDITAFKPKQAGAIFLTDDPEFAGKFSNMSADWMASHAEEFLTPQQMKDAVQLAIKNVKSEYGKTKTSVSIIKSLQSDKPVGEAADRLVEAYKEMLPSGPNIVPAYVKAENPFDYANAAHVNKVVASLKDNVGDYPIMLGDGRMVRYKDIGPVIKVGNWNAIESEDVQQAIKDAGFDGFYILEQGRKNLAVYDPAQIKSATGNEGTYDINNPDIRKSLRSAAGMFDQDELKKRAVTGYKSREKVVEMDIDDFLNLADYTNSVTDSNSREKMANARERVANGTKFTTLPYMSIQGYSGTLKVTGHEGRHRAKALKEVGYKTIPVLLHSDIRWSEQNDPEKFDYEKDWPKRIEAQEGAINPNFSIPFPFTREESGMDYEIAPQARASLRTNVKNDISSMPNGAAILATMNRVTPPRETKGFAERITNALAPETFSYIRQNFLDRYNRLNDYDKMVAKQMGGIELLANQSAHWASLNSDMAAGITASALGVGDRMGGTPVLKNGYFTVSTLNGTVKGLVEIISPLARHGDPDIYRSYQLWSAAKRGTRLNREGRFELMTPKEIKDALTLEQKYPEFVDVQKEWIKFNNGLVKMQVDAGIITKEAGQEFMKYSDYLPLYRQIDGQSTVGPSIYQSISGVKAPKNLKGKSTAPIEDYLETIVRNTQAAIQSSMKNVAAKKAVENGMILGMVTKLPAVSSSPDTITILENGKKVSYQCADKLFVEAVSSLNLPELPFLSILSKPADVLRALVTKDPGFMLANMMRDSLSAYITSGANINPVISTVKNFGDVMMHRSPSYQALLNAGVLGGYEFSRNVEAGAEALAKDLRKKTGTQSGAEKLFKPFTGVWDFLEHGTGASDAATRIAVYDATMKETGNEGEAIRRALEVMNFNRKGRSAVVRIAAAAIPFLNARVQGLDVFFRAGIRPFYDKNSTAYEKQVQKAMLIRGATVMALSTMYAAAIMGDPDYEKQEQETKDNFWLIPSLGIKIPIPFEVGTLFKTIPERIYRYYYGADTSKDLGDSMKRALQSTFAFNPVPQAVAPLMEARDNYSVFTQRPIVSDAMKNVAPEYQVGPSTSKFAELLGKQTGMSPILIDHVYKGYTGTMGMYLVDVMDSVYSAGSDNPKASQRFEQTPVLKRFLLDPEARGQVSAFYDLKHSVDQTVRTVNLLEKQNSPELGEYISQNVSMLGAKQYVSSVDKQMQKLNAQAAMIRSTPMPADEKRKMLDEIAKVQNELTNEVQLMRKMARP